MLSLARSPLRPRRLAASAAATAATPSAMLAKSLKSSLQATYNAHHSGFKFTTLTCKIAAAGTTASCQAHFTDASARAVGVLQVHVTIDRSTGAVNYKAVSIKCTDSKTGKAFAC